MAAFLQEAAPSHENSYMVARDETGAAKIEHDSNGFIDGQNPWNSVSGRVWLETGGLDKGIVATGPSKNTADPAADGYTVYASTLTKDGAAANQKLHEQYKNDPDKLAEATKKMLEDHPEYILKTVSGTTDAEGRYTLRFNDGQTATQQSRDNLNVDHMFLWVENKDGVVQHGYTGFHTPVFQRFTAGGNFRPSAVPAPNVLTPDISRNRIYNVNYALMPYSPVSITADYNAIDKPAAPGTTVTPEFKGDLSDLPSKIEWRDKNGKVVKTCDLDQSKSVKAQVAACTFGIPADAKKGDIFNVVVVSGGNDVAAWSVLVTDKNPDADIYEPAYEDKLVVPGKETKSSPSFTGKDDKDVKAPEGSEFKITDGFTAPEGYEVKIDENTGEITVTFPDGSKLNKDTVEQFDVPVTVTYPDGSTDKTDANFKLDTDNDGKPDTEDGDDDNDGIPDKDDSNPKVPNANDHFEPGYEDGSGKPGSDVKIDAPKFTDKDGKDTKAPEGTKFTPGENAPGGVTIDKDTGEITVTIPGDAKPGDKITVPVEVTYPDGTKDNVDVTVTVEQPDAPAPKQNEEFEPGYEDGSGKPGEDVKVPAPGFKDKDGKDTKAPEGTKFTPGENAPGGVTIDKDTGEITVTIPGDAKPGDKITVPVEVTYPDGSKDNVDVTVTVEKDATPVTQRVTFGVKVDGSIVESDGDNTTAEELPESVRDVVVTLTAEDGTEFKSNDNGETWRGAKGSPVVQNFGLADIPAGTYKVSVSGLDDVNKDNLKLKEDSQLRDGATVEITGNTGNLFVELEAVDSKKYEPAYEDKLVVPGKETKSSPSFTGKDDKDVKAPEGSEFKITDGFTAPEGYEVKIDENTGEITVTFPDGSKLNKDTVEQFDVPVTVTYPDGSTDKTDANFKLDTDNDGKPDTEDGDDDNDGIPDKDDSNPKVPNANDHFEPGYEDGSGKPGSDVKIDAPKFTDKDGKDTKAPEGTKFTPGENVPDGVKIDENTGEITVSIPEDAKPGDKITVPVVVTYPDGTKDTVDVTVTVTDKDAGLYEPAYEGKLVVPGEETKSSPSFTGKDDKDVKAPEGSEFKITDGFTAPEGYEVKIDENTGEITVTFPDGSKLNKDTVEQFDVPVTVTYPDGSTDKTDANFKLDTDNDGKPDTEDGDDDNDGIPDKDDSNPKVPNANDHFEPGYEDGSGKPGSDVKIDAPKFTDKDGKDTKAPEGTKFTPGENAPGGVTIDKDTGEITVTIPGDAKPGDKITVPVEVTYPDGTKDNVDVTVTVEQPDAPAPKQNEEFEPGYEDGSGKPGDDVKVPAPEFKDKDGKDTKAPEGTKFTPGDNAPDGVTIDENTGEITVKVPEDAKPGDKITVPVVVTYPDGSKDTVDVTVTVEEPEAPAEKPDWNDDKGQPGDKVEIPNTGGPVEDGTTVETEGPGKAEIDEDGKITVDIDKDAKPGDKVVVIVKDKDGNEIDRVVVEVEKPADKPAEKPDWKDNSGKPGENVVIPNEGGKVPEGSTVETEGPGKAEIDEDGNLVVDINDDAKPGDKVTVVVKDKDGKVIDTVTVTVEKPEAPAEQPAPGGNDNGTAQPKPGTSNGNGPVKRVPLPRTGAEVAGVAGAAAALIAAGLGLVFSRRRREGEEN